MRQFIVLGKECLMEDSDYFKYLPYGYSLRHDGKGYYSLIFSGGKLRGSVVSRVLLNAPPDRKVDHIDGNSLNNLRANLRLATDSQSMANRGSVNSLGLKGVSKNRNGYAASIMVNKKKIYLGTFPFASMAAAAYDRAAKHYFGDFAQTN